MIKKILYYVVNTLSVLIIAAAVLVLLSVVLTRQGDTPNIMGYSVFRVMTGSMEPEIMADDLIVVKKTEPEEIQVGDVISFYSPDPSLRGAVNTHRVTSVQQDGNRFSFATKGDANLIEDEYPVEQSAVIGVVVFVSGFLGALSRLVSNPIVFIPVILVPLLIILVTNLVKTARLAKAAVQEEDKKALAAAIEEVKRRKASQEASAEETTETDTAAAEPEDAPPSDAECITETEPEDIPEE